MSADESAIDADPSNRSALARAMLTFSDASEAGDSVGIDPARVDYLLGEPPRWRFPAMLCLAAIGLLALIVTTAVLVGREASGTATLAPPFLSAQPCVVVLATIPAMVGLVAVRRCAGPGPRANDRRTEQLRHRDTPAGARSDSARRHWRGLGGPVR